MFFSVIVPVYHVEKYLCECVDSILSQSFSDFEVILVDDGSKDGSPAICDAYATKDSRVCVIHKENGGQSTARNRGLEAAAGEYILFLDSDDKISTDTFFADVRAAIDTTAYAPTDVIVYRYCKYYADHTDDCGIRLDGITAMEKDALLQELVRRDAFFCSAWSKILRRALLTENGIAFDESLSCEDMDWYYRVVEKATRFRIIDKPYIHYRQRENSVTSVFKEKSIRDYIFTLKKWSDRFEALPDGEEKTVLLSSLAKLYCNLLISYSGHRKELKPLREEIFSLKFLLSYPLNPRAKVFARYQKYFGMRITCLLLSVLLKVR